MNIALSVLFVNVALTDATSDTRIQAYKANKLIPQNIVLPTSTGAADSDEVVLLKQWKFRWADQITVGRQNDGENFGCGMVDICDTQVYDFVMSVRNLSEKMYKVRLSEKK